VDVATGAGRVALMWARVLAATPGSWTYRAFDQGWLRSLGKYSYAIYLFHYPLLNYFRYIYRMDEVPEVWGARFRRNSLSR
jgi:peptidoglycan/LPS O-acetylase OafA/YrhL